MCKNMHSVKVPILRYGVKVTHVCSDRLLLEPMHVSVLCVINGKTVFIFHTWCLHSGLCIICLVQIEGCFEYDNRG